MGGTIDGGLRRRAPLHTLVMVVRPKLGDAKHRSPAPWDFVVGGRNFGQGSSREHAPTIIKMAGVSAVIAKSFARIFFRNCINVGLPAVIIDTDKIDEGDVLELDLVGGKLIDLTKGESCTFRPLPKAMANILGDGGLVEHIKKHGDFKLD